VGRREHENQGEQAKGRDPLTIKEKTKTRKKRKKNPRTNGRKHCEGRVHLKPTGKTKKRTVRHMDAGIVAIVS